MSLFFSKLSWLMCLGIIGVIGCMAQSVSLGVVAGFGPTQDFQNRLGPSAVGQAFPLSSLESNAKRYIVGTALHLWPSRALSLEVDALYRPLGFINATVLANGTRRSVSPATVVTWQFPLLVKYRFPAYGRISPLVVVGPSFRLVGNLNNTWPGWYAFTTGAGFEARVGTMVVSSAIRYTRWSGNHFSFTAANTKKDQIEFVVGMHCSRHRVLSPRLSLGLALGATLSTDFKPVSRFNLSGVRTPLFGPVLSFQLTSRWELEASAMNHPLRVSSRTAESSSRIERLYTTWDIPLLARYRLTSRQTTPVVGGGFAYRLPQQINGANVSSLGFVADGGYEFRIGRLKFTPRLRYTR